MRSRLLKSTVMFLSLTLYIVAFQANTASQFNRDRARNPGVRGGPAGAGNHVAGLPDGLEPRMNLDGCGGCHAQPAVGARVER
ncbi:MAG TPA: hypothetical protein VHJ58_20875 [Vicinamibacterales bacterium]|jgi:hypothetical protein|nr:hypothetical protein [Vicinamibacterales bacterium]